MEIAVKMPEAGFVQFKAICKICKSLDGFAQLID